MNPTVKSGTLNIKWKNLMIRQRFELEPFSSAEGTVHVGQFGYVISRLSYGLHWTDHRLYINFFFKDKGHKSPTKVRMRHSVLFPEV